MSTVEELQRELQSCREALAKQTQAMEEATSHAESEKFFQLSLDMMCIANTDGYFKRINNAFVVTLGYTEEELMAEPFVNFVHPDDQEKTIAAVVQLSEGIPVVSFQNRYRCADGTWKVISWRAATDTNTGQVFAAAHDETERLKMEGMQKALQAREAHQLGKIEMASGILHDLGNVLSGIGTRTVELTKLHEQSTLFSRLTQTASFLGQHVEPLRETFGEARANALIQLVEGMADAEDKAKNRTAESLQKLQAFISHAQDLLAAHRAYSGAGSQPVKKAIRLDKLLFDAQMMMSDAVQKREGVITIACGKNVPQINLEHDKLMQVLLNLIKNSYEAYEVDPDSKRLEIELRAFLNQDNELCISVEDNGPGISEEIKATLFHDGISTKQRGSGYGLGNVKRVIEGLGGQITLTNKHDKKGAKALICLPKEIWLS